MKHIWSMQGIYLMYGVSVMLAVWSIYSFLHIPTVKETILVIFIGFYGVRHVSFGLNFDTMFFAGETLISMVTFFQSLLWSVMARNPLAFIVWLVFVVSYFTIAYGLI